MKWALAIELTTITPQAGIMPQLVSSESNDGRAVLWQLFTVVLCNRKYTGTIDSKWPCLYFVCEVTMAIGM